MSVNFYNMMLEEIKSITGRPRLLLHSCCGPCSSSVMELLSKYFSITVFFFNPNIYPKEEFGLRFKNQKKLAVSMFGTNVEVIEGEYDYNVFLKAAKNLEAEREGGARCNECFRLRLEGTAKMAKEGGFDYFTTTLSVSPHKNSKAINTIGLEISQKYEVKYLMSDFKKKDGYKRSVELAKKYEIYRQEYCGCKFSLNNRKALVK